MGIDKLKDKKHVSKEVDMIATSKDGVISDPVWDDIEKTNIFKCDVTMPTPLLNIRGNNGYMNMILTPGNISVISGQPKVKKSMFITMLLATMANNGTNPYKNMSARLLETKKKVVFFDTEQVDYHIKRFSKMVESKVANIDNLIMKGIGDKTFPEKYKYVTTAIKRPEVGVVFVDNIRHLIGNVNDLEKSNELVEELVRLARANAVHLVFTLHTNKGDGKLSGHLGSTLRYMAECVFLLEREDDNESNVCAEVSKNETFQEFSFRLIDSVIPDKDGYKFPNIVVGDSRL